jgi:hypothetical protein
MLCDDEVREHTIFGEPMLLHEGVYILLSKYPLCQMGRLVAGVEGLDNNLVEISRSWFSIAILGPDIFVRPFQ